TGATLIVTVPWSTPPRPSATANTKLSTPLKFGSGVYVTAPVAGSKPLNVPCDGPLTMANVSSSSSASSPVSVITTGPPSSMASINCAPATGAVFAGAVTSIVTVAGTLVSSFPGVPAGSPVSAATNVKLSGPT